MSAAPFPASAARTYTELEDDCRRLREMLRKAAQHIDALGDPVSAALILEACK